MIFAETLPIFYSLGLIIAVSATVFIWRFYIFRKKSLAAFYSIPSIIIGGIALAGKTSLIKAITKNEMSTNIFLENFQFSRFKNGNILQLIEMPDFNKADDLERLKKLNLKSMIYLFDVSKDSLPIVKQIDSFENTKRVFDNIPAIILASKADSKDSEKITELKKKFEKIYEISALGKDKDSMLVKEFEDLNHLIKDISLGTKEELGADSKTSP